MGDMMVITFPIIGNRYHNASFVPETMRCDGATELMHLNNTRCAPSGNSIGQLLAFLRNGSSEPASCPKNSKPLLGVIEGSGIGKEVVNSALRVLDAVTKVLDLTFDVRYGGPVGEEAEANFSDPLPATTVRFFKKVLDGGGAVLSGPGGGRYVYDLRRRFDLFCKFVPVRPWPELARSAQIATENLARVDLLIVRDNVGGIYQGRWRTRTTPKGKIAEHSFSYSEAQVHRLVEVAVRAAVSRHGRLHVIGKDSGVPTITALWREISAETARQHGIEAAFMNVDLAAYELVRNPSRFDVMLTTNLFGDILVDITGALLGSRGVTFSGNFNEAGYGVYQTNHGCAHDLAGTDVANPVGQILALAMLLRESFGLEKAATLMEAAVLEAWRQGWRTADLAEPGCRILGTRAMTEQIVDQVFQVSKIPQVA